MNKKAFLTGFLILLWISAGGACRRVDTGDEAYSGTEGKYENCLMSCVLPGRFLETADKYYVIRTLEMAGDFVYVTDKGSMGAWRPLCNRQDCAHNSRECDAFIPSGRAIGYYKNHLYFCDLSRGSCELWRMDMDGRNHEKVKILNSQESLNIILFHKGYAIFDAWSKVGDDVCRELRALPLEKGKDEHHVMIEINTGAAETVYPMEQMVYLYRFEEGKTDFSYYNIENKSLMTLEENVQEPLSLSMNGDELTMVLKGTGIYRFDIKEEEKEELTAWNYGESDAIYTDGVYFYCGRISAAYAPNKEPGGFMEILDRNGALIQKIAFPQDKALYYYGATENHIFFYNKTDGVYAVPEYYLEKDKIGTEELKWKQIEH